MRREATMTYRMQMTRRTTIIPIATEKIAYILTKKCRHGSSYRREWCWWHQHRCHPHCCPPEDQVGCEAYPAGGGKLVNICSSQFKRMLYHLLSVFRAEIFRVFKDCGPVGDVSTKSSVDSGETNAGACRSHAWPQNSKKCGHLIKQNMKSWPPFSMHYGGPKYFNQSLDDGHGNVCLASSLALWDRLSLTCSRLSLNNLWFCFIKCYQWKRQWIII